MNQESSMLPKHTDVLIVGAGPTGLALAITLQQAGIRHVLVDKLSEGQNTSRAGVIHAHTLEMLEALGVAQDMTDRGLRLDTFTVRDRDRALMRLRFDSLPTTHHYMLMLPQDVTEKVLADRLVALGGAIHRDVTAVSAKQESGCATVNLATPEGESTVTARYVVGGDGMHSTVRAAAGLEFDGEAYADSFVLADVRMEWPLGASEVSLYFSPEGLLVVAPLPNGTFRIVATLDNAPERPALEDIQALMDTRGPADGKNHVQEVVWSSRFRIHHRLANAYRDGSFFLMGDAAHVHSPAGGQGMNTGLVDAVVLGRLLASVIQGHRPDSALDAYQQLRRPAAAQVLKLAGILTYMATVRGATKRALRNAIFSAVNLIPPVKRRLIMNLSGLSRRAFTLIPS
jgi:2-polyprenyl-6-methoxyphenol hydroxylase-like FAD-dependent oxidoreductase